MRRTLALISLSMLVLTVVALAHAQQPAGPAELDRLLNACNGKLDDYAREASTSRLVGNIVLLVGAAIAGVSSAFAGFVTKAKLRKIAGVTGAAGAVLAVIPRMLADGARWRIGERRLVAITTSA